MRILFDSKKLIHKDPFGTLTPNQCCTLRVHIPCDVHATRVVCILNRENGSFYREVLLERESFAGAYEIYKGQFSLEDHGLYFYYFHICHDTGSFRLFKDGDDANMESGSLWQVSCVPADFKTPDPYCSI